MLKSLLFIAKCCSSMIASSTEPEKSKRSDVMGQYKFYQMGSNGRPIYSNSNRTKYLYFDDNNHWAVCYELSICYDLKLSKLT